MAGGDAVLAPAACMMALSSVRTHICILRGELFLSFKRWTGSEDMDGKRAKSWAGGGEDIRKKPSRTVSGERKWGRGRRLGRTGPESDDNGLAWWEGWAR